MPCITLATVSITLYQLEGETNWSSGYKEKELNFPPKVVNISKKAYRDIHAKRTIDKITKNFGHVVLRLPPYHCELDAIELASMGRYNEFCCQRKHKK